MKIAWIASALLAVGSVPALAQQPAVYPLRSQTAALQSVDSAYCYWQAKRETGVDMARQSQRPPRIAPTRFAADAGRGASEPPLPVAASVPSGVSRAPRAAATAGKAGEISAGSDASALLAARTSAPPENGRSGQLPAAPAGAPGPASVSASASAQSSASPAAGLPPLPPPLPPMASYWQAYGDCMQGRGYGVH